MNLFDEFVCVCVSIGGSSNVPGINEIRIDDKSDTLKVLLSEEGRNKKLIFFSFLVDRYTGSQIYCCMWRLNSPAIVYKTTRNVIPTFENINAVKARQ
jgi:hypothetical protein